MSNRYSAKTSKVKKVEKVWNKLLKHLPKAYRNIQLGLVFTEMPKVYKTYQGGYAVPHTINIGTEYLNRADDEVAIAEILGHELGHHVLGHMNLEEEMHPIGEQDADHFGMMLCELAGYSRSSYIDWFKKFEKRRAKTLSKKHKKEHGTGDQRTERLNKQDKYLSGMMEEE